MVFSRLKKVRPMDENESDNPSDDLPDPSDDYLWASDEFQCDPWMDTASYYEISEEEKSSDEVIDSGPAGVDWGNDELFFTHEWRDETSMFDSDPSTRFEGEYYSRKFKARVPVAFRNSPEMITEFIGWMADRYPDCQAFWAN